VLLRKPLAIVVICVSSRHSPRWLYSFSTPSLPQAAKTGRMCVTLAVVLRGAEWSCRGLLCVMNHGPGEPSPADISPRRGIGTTAASAERTEVGPKFDASLYVCTERHQVLSLVEPMSSSSQTGPLQKFATLEKSF
jgi:hypothetical protein